MSSSSNIISKACDMKLLDSLYLMWTVIFLKLTIAVIVSDTSEDWLEKCILESPIELSSLSDLKNEADNGLLQLEPFPLSPGLPS